MKQRNVSIIVMYLKAVFNDFVCLLKFNVLASAMLKNKPSGAGAKKQTKDSGICICYLNTWCFTFLCFSYVLSMYAYEKKTKKKSIYVWM